MNSGFPWFTCFILVKVLQVEWKTMIEFYFQSILLFKVITFGRYAIGLWRIILYTVTPIMVLKQIISLIHLYTAALDMASIDEADRANKTKTK